MTTPAIPPALTETAALYGLTINHDRKMRRYFINDENTVACLGTYQEWEFNALDAETLEADIEQAIDNYQPVQFDAIAHEQSCKPGRHPNGHYR